MLRGRGINNNDELQNGNLIAELNNKIMALFP